MEKSVDPKDIAVFVEVCRQHSFSKAAGVLGLPNSHVSRRVKDLEEALDVRLINRSTRRFELTKVGEIYAGACADGLNRIAAANEYIESLKGAPQGRLFVVAPYELGLYLSRQFLVSFMKNHPKVDIELVFKNRAEVRDYAKADVILDIGVTFAPQNFKQRQLTTLHRYIYASPVRLANHKEIKHPSDIDKDDLIGFHSERGRISATHPEFINSDTGERFLFDPSSRLKVNSLSAMRNVAAAGFGFAPIAPLVVEEELTSGRLEKILPQWSSEPIPILAVYESSRDTSPKISVFVNELMDFFDTNRLNFSD